jgi:hypothetical protein
MICAVINILLFALVGVIVAANPVISISELLADPTNVFDFTVCTTCSTQPVGKLDLVIDGIEPVTVKLPVTETLPVILKLPELSIESINADPYGIVVPY